MTIITWQRNHSISRLHADLGKHKIAGGILIVLTFCLVASLIQRFDAPLVLGAAVCLAAAIPLFLWPELATLTTAFLLYINFPAILTKQHGMPEIVAGAFILLLGIPLFHYLIPRRESIKIDYTLYLMLVFLTVLLLASLGAVDQRGALGRVQSYLLEGFLLYFLIVNAVRSLQTLRRLIWAVLVAGSLLASLSLFQEVTGSYTKEFGGLAYRNYVVIQDSPDRDGPLKRAAWDRAQGPVNEPNRFAQILVVLLPLAVFSYRSGRKYITRVSAAIAGVLILGGVLITLSRGAFVTLIFLSVAMATLKWLRPAYLLIGALALLLGVSIVNPFFLTRMQSIANASHVLGGDPASAQEADGAILGRTTSMLTAFTLFLDYPVLGVGPGQFSHYYAEYSDNPEIKFREIRGTRRAHTLYFEMAAETGIVGLTAFLAIVVLLTRELWRVRQRWLARDAELANLPTAFCLCLLTYLCTAVFLHLSYQRYYWFLIAMAGAALHVSRSRSQPTQPSGFDGDFDYKRPHPISVHGP